MLDRNKLNRVKGILSARLGAEIPKYEGGAKFTKKHSYQNATIYSNDGVTWFTDPQLTNPYTGDLIDYQDTAIPGAQPITPYTGVEKAAEFNEKVELWKTDQIVYNGILPDVTIIANDAELATKPRSINDTVDVKNAEVAALPKQIEVPAKILEETKSQGMKLIQEKLQQDRKLLLKLAVGSIATEAFLGIGNAIGTSLMATDSTLTTGANAVYDIAADVVSKVNPAVGAVLKTGAIAGNIIQSLGGGTDLMTTTDKWMDSSFFSWNIGMLNGFGGKKADSFAVDEDVLETVGSSYGGTSADIMDAASKSGKKYGLFSSKSRKKANRQMAGARAKLNIMEDISDLVTDLRLHVQSMGEQAGLAYSLMTDGGYNLKYTYAAKHGGLLEWNPVISLEWLPLVELNWELPEFKEGGSIDLVEELEWIPEFKDGGKTKELDIPEIEETILKNVIPEGALHKNKHHMEHAEGLTKKGIPVIDEDGEQQAEIEHSEIIFTLEVTKKLEEYYDIFYSNESTNKEKELAALDAGKLLVYQILENTDDRTGLIESCKKGGTLNLKKSTEDLIEEALEWVPIITIVEEVIEEAKKEEPEKKSEKEMMKEAIKEVLIELLTK